MSADASDLSRYAACSADQGGIRCAVLKYQHKLVQAVMRYVRNPAEAEDIAQEAFIKAYQLLRSSRRQRVLHLLYRIAINTAKNAVVFPVTQPHRI